MSQMLFKVSIVVGLKSNLKNITFFKTNLCGLSMVDFQTNPFSGPVTLFNRSEFLEQISFRAQILNVWNWRTEATKTSRLKTIFDPKLGVWKCAWTKRPRKYAHDSDNLPIWGNTYHWEEWGVRSEFWSFGRWVLTQNLHCEGVDKQKTTSRITTTIIDRYMVPEHIQRDQVILKFGTRVSVFPLRSSFPFLLCFSLSSAFFFWIR